MKLKAQAKFSIVQSESRGNPSKTLSIQVCSIPSVQVFAAQWGQGIELLL